jgi:hypothetical protein
LASKNRKLSKKTPSNTNYQFRISLQVSISIVFISFVSEVTMAFALPQMTSSEAMFFSDLRQVSVAGALALIAGLFKRRK